MPSFFTLKTINYRLRSLFLKYINVKLLVIRYIYISIEKNTYCTSLNKALTANCHSSFTLADVCFHPPTLNWRPSPSSPGSSFSCSCAFCASCVSCPLTRPACLPPRRPPLLQLSHDLLRRLRQCWWENTRRKGTVIQERFVVLAAMSVARPITGELA